LPRNFLSKEAKKFLLLVGTFLLNGFVAFLEVMVLWLLQGPSRKAVEKNDKMTMLLTKLR
jgi:hypothetical protein